MRKHAYRDPKGDPGKEFAEIEQSSEPVRVGIHTTGPRRTMAKFTSWTSNQNVCVRVRKGYMAERQ